MALYATRTARQDSLGFSPFELMFGRNPREPLRILYEDCQDVGETRTVSECVMNLRHKLQQVHAIARENLGVAQKKRRKIMIKGQYRESLNQVIWCCYPSQVGSAHCSLDVRGYLQ